MIIPLWATGFTGIVHIWTSAKWGGKRWNTSGSIERSSPEEVLARIIGERIVRKRRREGERRKKKRERSLEELAAELGWE